MATVKGKVQVGLRALIARIERVLAPQGLVLRKSRTADQRKTFGEWFVANRGIGRVVRDNVDVEQFAREVQALEPWEQLDDSDGCERWPALGRSPKTPGPRPKVSTH